MLGRLCLATLAVPCSARTGARAARAARLARAAQRLSVPRLASRCRAQQQALNELPDESAPSTSQQPCPDAREEATRNFAGSMAILGLGAVLLSERLNGEGVVSQLELWSHDYIEPLLVFTIAALVVAGLKPTKDFARKAASSAAFGLQNIAGRIGFLGLAASLTAEMVTGKGLLGLLHIETGVELSEAEGILTFLIMLIATNYNSAVSSKYRRPRT